MDINLLWKDVEIAKARLERIQYDVNNAIIVLNSILLTIEKERIKQMEVKNK